MPQPKGPQPVDPKLLEREKQPSMTVSMGMKMTHNSTVCWRDQVQKEGSIRNHWSETYNPGWEQREADVLARVQARDAARKAEADARPERPLLFDGVTKDGKGRGAYLKARLALPLQQRLAQPLAASQVVGWSSRQPLPVNPNDPWRRHAKHGGGPFRRPGDDF